MSEKERIERAAIQRKGTAYSVPAPGRHHDVFRMMHDTGIGPDPAEQQGFITSRGKFVNRELAWRIAREAGQLLQRAPTDGRGGTLYSEDVW